MTLGHVLMALDAMKSTWLWMTRMTLGHELRPLYDMNNVRM